MAKKLDEAIFYSEQEKDPQNRAEFFSMLDHIADKRVEKLEGQKTKLDQHWDQLQTAKRKVKQVFNASPQTLIDRESGLVNEINQVAEKPIK